jgi:hypothetical protein
MGRRLALGAAAGTVLIGLIAAAGVTSASAKGPAAPVNATGTVSCTRAAGLVKLAPSFSNGGSATSANASVKVNLSGCSAANSNVTTAQFTGHGMGSITLASNNCATLSGTQTVNGTITVRWTGKAGTGKVNASTLSLTSLTILNPGTLNGNLGLKFTSQAVSGSFGGTASAEFDSAQSLTNLGTACGSSHGLTRVTIDAGTVSQP